MLDSENKLMKKTTFEVQNFSYKRGFLLNLEIIRTSVSSKNNNNSLHRDRQNYVFFSIDLICTCSLPLTNYD